MTDPLPRLPRPCQERMNGTVSREGWASSCSTVWVAIWRPGWGGQPVFMLRAHWGKSELDTWIRSLFPAATRAATGPRSIRYS